MTKKTISQISTYSLRSNTSFLDASPDHISIPKESLAKLNASMESEDVSSEAQETDLPDADESTSYKKMLRSFNDLLDTPAPISYCEHLDIHPDEGESSPNYVRCKENDRLHKQHNYLSPDVLRPYRHYKNDLERYPYRIDLNLERKTAIHMVNFTPVKKEDIKSKLKENIPSDHTANIQFSPGQNLSSPLKCRTTTPSQAPMFRASKFHFGEERVGFIFVEPAGVARTYEQTFQLNDDIAPKKLEFTLGRKKRKKPGDEPTEEKLPASPVIRKVMGPVKINLAKLSKGLKRSQNRSQNKVMHYISAAIAAGFLKFLHDDIHKWEWLHLLAYSFGCLKVSDIQHVKNLVGGRKEVNSQMMIIEHVVKELLKKKEVSEVIITVEATAYTSPLTGKPTHLGEKIHYFVQIPGLETLEYIFEPLKDYPRPSISEFYYHRTIITRYLAEDESESKIEHDLFSTPISKIR